MGRVARAEQLARTQARERRSQAMEQDRRDRDRRIEDALVEVILALQARDHAGRLAEYAETRIGGALRRLLADDVDVAQAAQLCQLTCVDSAGTGVPAGHSRNPHRLT